MLEANKQSVASITPRVSVTKVAKLLLQDEHVQEWSNTLDQLTVQSEFDNMVMLEEESKTWIHLV